MVFPEPDDGGDLRNLLDLEANLGKLGLNNADLSRWLADSKGRADHEGQFAEAIRLKPDLAGAYQHLGLVYAIKGNREGAFAEYRWLRNRNPGRAKKLKELLGKILLK